MKTSLKRLAVCASVLSIACGVSGCVAIPADRGTAQTEALLAARINYESDSAHAVRWRANREVCEDLTSWLGEPLTADRAVTTALQCSPQLQRLYAELALTQAEVYEATRLSNPQLGFARMATGAPENIVSTTWSISQRFIELLFLPSRQGLGRDQLLASQQRIAHDVLQLERSVRAAYVTYVSAASIAELEQRAATAADLSAQTAQAFHAAGNINELQLSRERAAAVEAQLVYQRASIDAVKARSELLTAIGVAPKDPATLVAKTPLPLPSSVRDDVNGLHMWAREQRLDLQAARLLATAQSKHARQQRWWRWFGDVEAGFERESETHVATRSGPSIAVGLPLFNSRKNVALRADAQLESAQARLTQIEVQLDNDVHAVLHAARAAQAASKAVREQLVPLRERITALSLREFNFMFIGTFELLAVKREEIQAYRHYLEAIRDEWLAQIEVQRIAGGKLPATLLVNIEDEVQP
jgi:cobalt-zinc-cadmium efflux system outer membrane protein